MVKSRHGGRGGHQKRGERDSRSCSVLSFLPLPFLPPSLPRTLSRNLLTSVTSIVACTNKHKNPFSFPFSHPPFLPTRLTHIP